ncbi:MAG: ABC transporter permease, partial [Bdellovibrionota bacterium]
RAALMGALLFGFSFSTDFLPQFLHSTALQVLTQFTGILGVTLFAPLPVSIGVRFLRMIFLTITANRGGSVAVRLAADNLLRNPTRTSNNIRSLTVGLVLVIVIASISHSFKTTIGAWLNVVLKSDLIVSSQGKLQRYLVQPLDEAFGRELALVPGVQTSGETVFGMRFIKVKYRDVTLGLKAYDRPDFGSKYDLFDMQDRPAAEAGAELYDSLEPTVFVSNNFVHTFGKTTGDTFELSTPQGAVTFRIAGIVNDFAVAEGVLYISRERFKTLWRDNLVTLFAISVKPGVNPETVRQAIDGKWAQSRNIQALANDELRKQLGESIDSGFAFTWAIQIAALAIALMGLFNTLLISILERTRELGMMRAIGMTKKQLITMILGETTILGALGSITAVSIGSGLAYLFVTNTFEEILGWIIKFDLPITAALNTTLFGTGVAIVACLYPCYRAVRVQIRDALEYE